MIGQELANRFARGERHVGLLGPQAAHLAKIVAWLAAERQRSGKLTVIVTPDEDRARAFARDIAFFLPAGPESAMQLEPVVHLPVPQASPYAELSIDKGTDWDRMVALTRLNAGVHNAVGANGAALDCADEQLVPSALVCSAMALCRKVVPPVFIADRRFTIHTQQRLDRDALIQRLVAAGYDRFPVVDDPGMFAVRGGIVDLYPPLLRFPARIEFFDDTVESIRLFDPASQRTLRAVDVVVCHAVRETLCNDPLILRTRLLELADTLHHPTRSARALLERLELQQMTVGIEALTPAFHQRLEPLSCYIPADTLYVVVDRVACMQNVADEMQRVENAYHARIEAKEIAFSPPEFYSSASEITTQLDEAHTLEVYAAGAFAFEPVVATSNDHAALVAKIKRARNESAGQPMAVLAQQMKAWDNDGISVVVAAGDNARAAKLNDLLAAHGVVTTRVDRRKIAHTTFQTLFVHSGITICDGELSRGFLAEGLAVISQQEIFGPTTVRKSTPRAIGTRINDLRELKPDDYVVHLLHGVGRYKGLVKLVTTGVAADYLLLEYAKGDRLYLPVHRMSQVQRYVGSEGHAITLDRLGGASWQKKRNKVHADVRKFSEELLQLYAQRAALAGFAHSPPSDAYAEFEAGFPFSETPDQARAIELAIGDLTADRPMDRLVCGDVGFGKTEVALRAAFVAAMGGRQVALLAPTTVLVEQHRRTFEQRLTQFPLRVAAASRFCKPQELRDTLAGLADGKIDIVIGTHRLLSADVRFKDLGLLVVDEEQRFGVRHKEWIKRMRTQVDVLCMTATPIPRTLQLAMVGLREISVIASPPADRLAVRTVMCRYDEAFIADAVRKEIARGGQVFFVHNEVATLDDQARELAKIVPEARIAVAHGQMDGRRLERTMLDFVQGQYDMLVCSTIIESGLDMPRVNTMFIHKAHRFGLSQLHQLRGRIGRSHLRAYCYLLTPPVERISTQAHQRLQLLQQFADLGSGFSLASYDLEIRGAGDLLGIRQSGHIAAVGFETYARILQEAVAELKGEPIVSETDPDLTVQVEAFIPDDYVEDTGQRLELYKRFSDACRDERALAEIAEELHDRYGVIPPEVEALGELMVVKGLAIELKAAALELTSSRLTLTLTEDTPLSGDVAARLVHQRNSGFALKPPNRIIRRLDMTEREEPLCATTRILRELLRMTSR